MREIVIKRYGVWECTDAERHGLIKGTKILRHYGTKTYRQRDEKAAKRIDRCMDAKKHRGIVGFVEKCFDANPTFTHHWGEGCTECRMRGNGHIPSPRTRKQVSFAKQTEKNLSPFTSHFSLFTFHFSREGKRVAFTLAEVLITLGIIGIVAALISQTVIIPIQNKGYVERMKKAYSVIQNATNAIVAEEGDPSNWIVDAYSLGTNEPNEKVVDMYADRMRVAKRCKMHHWVDDECHGDGNAYFNLNGTRASLYYSLYYFTHPLILTDGTTIALHFYSNPGGGFLGRNPPLTFIVDVNSKKKPNKIGRDIFYFYITTKEKTGKVHPFGDTEGCYGFNICDLHDCSKDDTGLTCAYKILTEGKMNY